MATQLNIKDADTVALARAMAKRTGKTVTETVRQALLQADLTGAQQDAGGVEQFLAKLRSIPAVLPDGLAGKTSREIIKEFHEQEWQDQNGRDEWS